MHCWITFGARMSHGQTQTHKTHHDLNLGEVTTFPPYSILCASPRGPHPNGILSRDSQMGVPKLPTLGLPQLWGPITLCADIRSRWCLKKSCSPHRELSNGMLHSTCMQGNRVDSQLLVVGSQIANLTSGPSFGHNLCFKCPNGSCEPTLDIYVPKDFQWYKELPNLMGFDPYNCSLKIWKSIGTPTPKMGAHLGVWVFIFTLSYTLRLPYSHAPLQALALVASPRLGLRHNAYLND